MRSVRLQDFGATGCCTTRLLMAMPKSWPVAVLASLCLQFVQTLRPCCATVFVMRMHGTMLLLLQKPGRTPRALLSRNSSRQARCMSITASTYPTQRHGIRVVFYASRPLSAEFTGRVVPHTAAYVQSLLFHLSPGALGGSRVACLSLSNLTPNDVHAATLRALGPAFAPTERSEPSDARKRNKHQVHETTRRSRRTATRVRYCVYIRVWSS